MRRPLSAFAFLAVVIVAFGAGCGSTSGNVVPVATKAPPQEAQLGWEEPYPADGAALVFGVSSFAVTATGWKATISIENRSQSNWEVRPGAPGAFGILLFPNDDAAELERRNRNGDLPTIRSARTFSPALPDVLTPGKTWKGTMTAPGALAGGLWVRVSFGPFTSVGEPSNGAQSPVVWFTDHAYQLEAVAAVEAEPA